MDLSPGIIGRILEGCLGQVCSAGNAALFIWTAVPYRMAWRYGDRGYRYLHLDAGHSCQNLYLAAEAVGCGACALGAFDDGLMNRVLGIDGVEQFTIYTASVGKKP
jgi:SagB-type dehydrogenase family enzyme